MAAINKLPSVQTLSTADTLALFSNSLGNDAQATLATVLGWLQA